MVLVLTVIRCPHLVGITGIHVEDARRTGSTERHESAAIDHHIGLVVKDFGGAIQGNGEGFGPAVEDDLPPFGYGLDESLCGATFGRAIANDLIRFGYVLRKSLGWHGIVPVRIPRWRPDQRISVGIDGSGLPNTFSTTTGQEERTASNKRKHE